MLQKNSNPTNRNKNSTVKKSVIKKLNDTQAQRRCLIFKKLSPFKEQKLSSDVNENRATHSAY